MMMIIKLDLYSGVMKLKFGASQELELSKKYIIKEMMNIRRIS